MSLHDDLVTGSVRARARDRFTAVLLAVLTAAVLFLLWGALAEGQRADVAQAQTLGFAEQLQSACESGAVEGAVCEDAAEVVESPPPAAPPPPADPSVTIIREDVPAGVLLGVAKEAVAAALPGLTEDARAGTSALLAEQVAACVESGACVGPAFPADEMTRLVADALDEFCADGACEGAQGPPGEDGEPGAPGPPGADGCCTEEQIAAIAARVSLATVTEYLSGRPVIVTCPRVLPTSGATTIECRGYVSSG